ncbi:hypothetical protein [Chondromyces apiculatus]|uniref:Uncharacterized protein n=1 Tax=Chondromyces apiculatus DSM 436 TaxID=1192034 RepID=A0A017SZB0_9BACT|nr:hypothetical protein [Chondromyces apiculatus]EYF02072.1 Hypothetical protein CAP_7551 [Chondromyces apiculatus DSM 436]
MVTCPSCSAAVEVPAPLRGALSTHGVAAVAGMAAARGEAAAGAAERADRAELARRNEQVGLLLTVGMGGGVLLSFLPIALGVQAEALRWMGPICVVGAVVGAALYTMGVRGRAALAPVVSPISAPVTCPGCGAPHVFHAADPTAKCRRCGTAVLPTPPVLAGASASAEAALVRERVARHRAERVSWPEVAPRRLEGFVALLPGAFLFGGAVLGVALGMASGALPTVLVLGGLGAASLAFGAFTWSNEVRAEQAAQRLTDLVLGEARGQKLPNPLAWLSAWWGGPAEKTLTYGGKHYRVFGVQPLGYQVLLVVNWVPAKYQEAGVHLLLAAWVPGASDRLAPDAGLVASFRRMPGAAAVLDALEGAGFEVTPSAGGLVCAATPATLARLRKMPEFLTVLPSVAENLAHLAAVIGARPIATPLP